MRTILLLSFVCIILLTACGRSEAPSSLRELEERDIRQAVVARSYGWQARTAQPQPRWNPQDNRLVLRGRDGIGILQEGAGGEFYTRIEGGHEHWDPQWWGPAQVVFGPRWRPREGPRPTFELPLSGLILADVGMSGIVGLRDLLDRGYAPQVWDQQRLIAQFAEELLIVQRDGTHEYFGRGFHPRPQPQGPGLAWQSTPFPYRDFWTGHSGSGDLVVRWNPETVDVIPGAFQATWVADGSLLATQVDPDQEGTAWPHIPSNLIHLPGPGKEVRILATQARDPAPHPLYACVAFSDPEGGIRLVSYDRRVDLRLARRGQRPQWNHDGSRLLVEERSSDGSVYLRVLVVVWRQQAEASTSASATEPSASTADTREAPHRR